MTISALSKTYAVTGWRVGWIVAPEALSGAIRSVHDFLTVAAPAPLQEAGGGRARDAASPITSGPRSSTSSGATR